MWVRIPLRRCVLDTTLFDKVCQWLATGRWFSPGTPNKTYRHDMAEIFLKVTLNTITLTPNRPSLVSSNFSWHDIGHNVHNIASFYVSAREWGWGHARAKYTILQNWFILLSNSMETIFPRYHNRNLHNV